MHQKLNYLANYISSHTRLFLGISCAITIAVGFYATPHGLIFTSDSFHYWAASRSFREAFDFISATNGRFVYWPPFFPMLLCLFSEEAYHVFHILLLASLNILLYQYFKRIGSKFQALLLVYCWTVSIFPYLIGSFLWSEVIFIFFLYSGLWLKSAYEQHQRKRMLIACCIVFMLMCLTRNAGIFIMIGISIDYFIQYLKSNLRIQALLMNALWIVISVLPLIGWSYFNLMWYPQAFDVTTYTYAADLLHNLNNFSTGIVNLVIPFLNKSTGFLSFTTVLVLVFISLFGTNRLSRVLLFTYLISFLVLPHIEMDTIDRFLSPVIPFILSSFIGVAYRLYQLKIKWMQWSIVLLSIILLCINIARCVKNVELWHQRSIYGRKSSKIYSLFSPADSINRFFNESHKELTLSKNKSISQQDYEIYR